MGGMVSPGSLWSGVIEGMQSPSQGLQVPLFHRRRGSLFVGCSGSDVPVWLDLGSVLLECLQDSSSGVNFGCVVSRVGSDDVRAWLAMMIRQFEVVWLVETCPG